MEQSLYLLPGRLQDVLALIQVLGLHPSPRRSESQLRDEILESSPVSAKRWSDVALGHPEFFRVAGKNQDSVSLAARHAFGEREDERKLPVGFVESLLGLAVDIHDREADREAILSDRSLRYLPLVIAIIGVAGSIVTALIALLIRKG